MSEPKRRMVTYDHYKVKDQSERLMKQGYTADRIAIVEENGTMCARPIETNPLRDGEPCTHPGCLRHLTHPCEGCGRVGGRSNSYAEAYRRQEDGK
jgi:hypothetical protein